MTKMATSHRYFYYLKMKAVFETTISHRILLLLEVVTFFNYETHVSNLSWHGVQHRDVPQSLEY